MPRGADDEQALTDDIIALARQYGRYGYRRVTALLRNAGWAVNRKRVERIWRREGLNVPQKQRKRGRLWLNNGSCIRLGYKIGTYPTGMLSPAIAAMQAGLAANAAGKQEAPGALPLPALRAVLGYDAYDAEAKPYRLPD